MFRQSPSRSQRSRGIKGKYVLQICFLLAICFWLIYQVKHSHDRRKELDDSDLKNSQQTQSSSEIFKFGRKDLHPRVEETATTSRKQDEEPEEENVGEEEENKHEEEHVEDKSEEKDDEGTGVGDDEIVEHEEEESQEEEDHEEDVMDEEMEKEEDDETENEEKDSEEIDGQLENDISLEEHDDNDDEKAHEAREEHYKADDVSSAVTHESEVISGQNEKGNSENSSEFSGKKVIKNENVVNNTDENEVDKKTTVSKIEDRRMTETGGPSNTTANGNVENVGSRSDDSSLPLNSESIGTSNDHLEQLNHQTEASTGAHGLSMQNTRSDFSQAEDVTTENTTYEHGPSMGKNSTFSSADNQADSNSSVLTKVEDAERNSGDASKASNSTLSIMSVKSVDSSIETGSQSKTEEANNATEAENADEVLRNPVDTSDSSIGLEEKEVRTDLETLPEIQIEGSNDKDAAAE